MTNLSASKSIRRNVCRAVGHEWVQWIGHARGGNKCSRCHKREVKWYLKGNVTFVSPPEFIGTLPARIDIPVGTTYWDTNTNSMVINNGNSWQILK